MSFDAKDLLLTALSAFTLFYFTRLALYLRAERRPSVAVAERRAPSAETRLSFLTTGFLTNFLDTLGIGSFATTTSIFRHFRLVKDELLPGTLNVGLTLGAIIQSFIFTKLVPVDARTLILMIAAAVTGAWFGAGIVSSWPRRRIQIGMGITLLGAATLMLLSALDLAPAGGQLLALHGAKLAVAVTVNLMLGALMTLGIGLYAPCMILVSLLGMNPIAAFPIMMGSCAFLMPVSSARFMRARRFDLPASLGLLLGSIPAVLIAAFLVKSLPLTAVRWLVVVVVVYTAVAMLRAARAERVESQPAEAAAMSGS